MADRVSLQSAYYNKLAPSQPKSPAELIGVADSETEHPPKLKQIATMAFIRAR